MTELFPPAAYEREDESPDARFYDVPRRVVHIDDGAIAALGRLYAAVLPPGVVLAVGVMCRESYRTAGQ